MSYIHPTVQTNLANNDTGTNALYNSTLATAQPLSFVVDPKIKGKIWANEYLASQAGEAAALDYDTKFRLWRQSTLIP
ncbi:uncharacterized protein LOC126825232 [Patella vulgata]|uniref:uncharacterized protein LOC126825232 n=1 Tax=Patella vulgata TaxID=6465 RepID=UPI0021805D12|nr:uncharacterized protein LOC126825232 [Patella vulgata]